MEITIVSTDPPCDKCTLLSERLGNIQKKYPQISLKKFVYEQNKSKFLNYNTPVLMINDCVISSGKVLAEELLEEFINNQLSLEACGCVRTPNTTGDVSDCCD